MNTLKISPAYHKSLFLLTSLPGASQAVTMSVPSRDSGIHLMGLPSQIFSFPAVNMRESLEGQRKVYDKNWMWFGTRLPQDSHWLQPNQRPQTNCKGGWKMQPSCVPKLELGEHLDKFANVFI